MLELIAMSYVVTVSLYIGQLITEHQNNKVEDIAEFPTDEMLDAWNDGGDYNEVSAVSVDAAPGYR